MIFPNEQFYRIFLKLENGEFHQVPIAKKTQNAEINAVECS